MLHKVLQSATQGATVLPGQGNIFVFRLRIRGQGPERWSMPEGDQARGYMGYVGEPKLNRLNGLNQLNEEKQPRAGDRR